MEYQNFELEPVSIKKEFKVKGKLSSVWLKGLPLYDSFEIFNDQGEKLVSSTREISDTIAFFNLPVEKHDGYEMLKNDGMIQITFNTNIRVEHLALYNLWLAKKNIDNLEDYYKKLDLMVAMQKEVDVIKDQSREKFKEWQATSSELTFIFSFPYEGESIHKLLTTLIIE
jgi:hypothetical protein